MNEKQDELSRYIARQLGQPATKTHKPRQTGFIGVYVSQTILGENGVNDMPCLFLEMDGFKEEKAAKKWLKEHGETGKEYLLLRTVGLPLKIKEVAQRVLA